MTSWINRLPCSVLDPTVPSSCFLSVCPSKNDFVDAYLKSVKLRGEAITNQNFYCKGIHFRIYPQVKHKQVQLISSPLQEDVDVGKLVIVLSDWLNSQEATISIQEAEGEHEKLFR
ncbi:hypothetical protein D5018_04210 [Parashewanella curva]|uniref:Uncharacterized protein n=1 Tax=Parashewanella curva TaxID=2338552 RepID=A0A3L8Q0A4_9GAMM|nr:hypothetical protein [Parashewanella curva]RLV61051.1 hypothetical protein D5018_04210 [Parashewanella curva]